MDAKEAWVFLTEWAQDPLKFDENGYNEKATIADVELAAESITKIKDSIG